MFWMNKININFITLIKIKMLICWFKFKLIAVFIDNLACKAKVKILGYAKYLSTKINYKVSLYSLIKKSLLTLLHYYIKIQKYKDTMK